MNIINTLYFYYHYYYYFYYHYILLLLSSFYHHISNSFSHRTTPESVQKQDTSEKLSDNLGPAQNETRQCERIFNRYDDPMFTPSYEMPTLASKLKRSSRSYFSRFNFHNIPFVVGTSVTPSHNLGLNIQQVSRRNAGKSSGYLKKIILRNIGIERDEDEAIDRERCHPVIDPQGQQRH